MAWVELYPATSELELKDGLLKWNTAMQLTMGDPPWVELLHDSANGWLGVRSANAPTGLPVVREPEGSEFSIDSEYLLDAAGIPTDITINASPPNLSEATVTTSPDQTPAYAARHKVHYLVLP